MAKQPVDRAGSDKFGNRSPAPFPTIATTDAKLDGLLRELVALPYGDKTDARRDALTKAVRTRFRTPRAGDPQALLGLLSDQALDLGALQPTDEGRGTPAVKRARKQAWHKVWGERYARLRTLQLLVQAALQHPACDARLADLVARPSLETAELVAEAVEEAEGKITIGPKLLAALAKRATRTGEGSAEAIAHEAVVKALLRAPVDKAFDALAPIVEKWSAAGKHLLGTLGQDVEEMQDIPLDERWRGVLYRLLAKGRLEAIAVLKKLPRKPGDVPVLLGSIQRDLAKIKRGHDGEPLVDEDALVLLAESGDRSVLPALLKVTECTDFGWDLRDVLFETIGKLGDASAIEPLQRFIDRNAEDGDAALVAAARAALKKLTKGKPIAKPAPKAGPKATRSTKTAPKPAPYDKAGPALAVPTTSPVEERAKLEARIAKAKLPSELVASLHGAIRGAIRIYTKRVVDDSLPVGTSRFGGLPDLPADTAWPRTAEIPMTFVAQLRLEELAPFDADRELPTRGLLAFFVHDDVIDDNDPEMYSAHAVLYFPDAENLERASLPDGFSRDGLRRTFASADLRFHASYELPSINTHEAKALGKEAVALALPASLELPRPATLNQVLGYDDYRDNGDVPSKGTRPLFRCDSDRQADMNYGDAQDIAFRIKDADLAAGRFDRVELWFQAG